MRHGDGELGNRLVEEVVDTPFEDLIEWRGEGKVWAIVAGKKDSRNAAWVQPLNSFEGIERKELVEWEMEERAGLKIVRSVRMRERQQASFATDSAGGNAPQETCLF